jgi:hypothetical protein
MTQIETRDESNALQTASDALDRHMDSYDRELYRAGWIAGRDWARNQEMLAQIEANRQRAIDEIEHSDAPWRFDPAPSDANMPDALRGHILPHGAQEDDPCVAYVEGVGSVDLAPLLSAPDMLAVLESVYVDLVTYSKRLSGSYDTGAIALGSCADQVHAVIRKAKGKGR